MDFYDTEHAGGGSKNRVIDEDIHLKKGHYIVNYITDDSHSYRDWNTDAPDEQEFWGITVWPVNKNDKDYVKEFDSDKYRNENVIVEITRVRDGEYLKKSFTLDEDTEVRIFAIGEGTRFDMVDYGWIENRDTGKVVWEMSYRMTDRAGGAKKNRLFNDTIKLKKGAYKVYYETDDSHSFNDWNSSPPSDPESYGITLLKEK